ncbi:hypothetical protein SNEBB_011287 [Seison nebaliae]|nr:hypothetical protein SNEBB_011287 [Seison nebaliae]
MVSIRSYIFDLQEQFLLDRMNQTLAALPDDASITTSVIKNRIEYMINKDRQPDINFKLIDEKMRKLHEQKERHRQLKNKNNPMKFSNSNGKNKKQSNRDHLKYSNDNLSRLSLKQHPPRQPSSSSSANLARCNSIGGIESKQNNRTIPIPFNRFIIKDIRKKSETNLPLIKSQPIIINSGTVENIHSMNFCPKSERSEQRERKHSYNRIPRKEMSFSSRHNSNRQTPSSQQQQQQQKPTNNHYQQQQREKSYRYNKNSYPNINWNVNQSQSRHQRRNKKNSYNLGDTEIIDITNAKLDPEIVALINGKNVNSTSKVKTFNYHSDLQHNSNSTNNIFEFVKEFDQKQNNTNNNYHHQQPFNHHQLSTKQSDLLDQTDLAEYMSLLKRLENNENIEGNNMLNKSYSTNNNYDMLHESHGSGNDTSVWNDNIQIKPIRRSHSQFMPTLYDDDSKGSCTTVTVENLKEANCCMTEEQMNEMNNNYPKPCSSPDNLTEYSFTETNDSRYSCRNTDSTPKSFGKTGSVSTMGMMSRTSSSSEITLTSENILNKKEDVEESETNSMRPSRESTQSSNSSLPYNSDIQMINVGESSNSQVYNSMNSTNSLKSSDNGKSNHSSSKFSDYSSKEESSIHSSNSFQSPNSSNFVQNSLSSKASSSSRLTKSSGKSQSSVSSGSCSRTSQKESKQSISSKSNSSFNSNNSNRRKESSVYKETGDFPSKSPSNSISSSQIRQQQQYQQQQQQYQQQQVQECKTFGESPYPLSNGHQQSNGDLTVPQYATGTPVSDVNRTLNNSALTQLTRTSISDTYNNQSEDISVFNSTPQPTPNRNISTELGQSTLINDTKLSSTLPSQSVIPSTVDHSFSTNTSDQIQTNDITNASSNEMSEPQFRTSSITSRQNTTVASNKSSSRLSSKTSKSSSKSSQKTQSDITTQSQSSPSDLSDQLISPNNINMNSNNNNNNNNNVPFNSKNKLKSKFSICLEVKDLDTNDVILVEENRLNDLKKQENIDKVIRLPSNINLTSTEAFFYRNNKLVIQADYIDKMSKKQMVIALPKNSEKKRRFKKLMEMKSKSNKCPIQMFNANDQSRTINSVTQLPRIHSHNDESDMVSLNCNKVEQLNKAKRIDDDNNSMKKSIPIYENNFEKFLAKFVDKNPHEIQLDEIVDGQWKIMFNEKNEEILTFLFKFTSLNGTDNLHINLEDGKLLLTIFQQNFINSELVQRKHERICSLPTQYVYEKSKINLIFYLEGFVRVDIPLLQCPSLSIDPSTIPSISSSSTSLLMNEKNMNRRSINQLKSIKRNHSTCPKTTTSSKTIKNHNPGQWEEVMVELKNKIKKNFKNQNNIPRRTQ